MASAEQLKALMRSHNSGDDEHFRAVALQIAAHAAHLGNNQLAQELRALIDRARRAQAPVGSPRAVPIARSSGELVGLVTASYPDTRLSEMVLSEKISDCLREVVSQYHQRDLLRSHGLRPRRKLLLVGPPGCGKTMSASAVAGECDLPLMFVQLHSLITKYMGETAVKLHLIFDAMVQTRGVYLFDEFDAIGSHRDTRNDVGEIRRVLNSFLQFLERDDSDSIIIAATNFSGMLDHALFRRFDSIIAYELPTSAMARDLIANRLTLFDISNIQWKAVLAAARNLSHAEITHACEDSARNAVLAGNKAISTESLAHSLRARNMAAHRRKTKGPPSR
ncbi:MAG: AAA family ATPase [Phycisphaerales bacterium]|nr:AAA family ATPase [Phycisphaerales bacterium]